MGRDKKLDERIKRSAYTTAQCVPPAFFFQNQTYLADNNKCKQKKPPSSQKKLKQRAKKRPASFEDLQLHCHCSAMLKLSQTAQSSECSETALRCIRQMFLESRGKMKKLAGERRHRPSDKTGRANRIASHVHLSALSYGIHLSQRSRF